MDFELYEKIRNTTCKIHKILEIKTSNQIISINRDDYIITLKANPFLKQFNSYSQFKEDFLYIFKNIDCYKITKFLNLHNLLKNVEILDITGEDDFEELKMDDDRFLILSGIVLTNIDEKSTIGFSTITRLTPNIFNPTESALTYTAKQTTIESYNNLYNLKLGEEPKLENIEIL